MDKPASNFNSRDLLERVHRFRSSRLGRIAAIFWLCSTALLLLVAIAVSLILNTARGHNYIIHLAESQASESLGVRVQLQNFALHFSTLSMDLYGVTVDGATPYAHPPLLQVAHAQAGVRIVSFLRRKWYLDSFQVDDPVVQVFVDNHGVSNLPVLKSSGNSSHTSIFDLGIRHAVLTRGVLLYNNRASAISGALQDLEFQASFNALLQRYTGRLAYSDGQIVYGAFAPLRHGLEMEFDATPAVFHLTEAKVSCGASQINLNATVNNYANPVVDGQYDIVLDGKQIGEILRSDSLPAGQLQANGKAHYQQAASQSFLDGLVIDGNLASPRLIVKTGTMHGEINGIAAHYSLAGGDVVLHDLHAAILGGGLAASGTMKNLGGNSRTHLDATLSGVSLEQAQRLLGPAAAKTNASLAGTLNAKAEVAWGKTMEDLSAKVGGAINGNLSGRGNQVVNANAAASATNRMGANSAAIPVESAIHVLYTASNQELAVNNSYLRTAQTDLTMNGVVSKQSSLNLRLQADDLHEVSTIANLFSAPAANGKVQSIDLSGKASFQGTVRGSTAAPHLNGQLLTTGLHVNGTAWKAFRAGVDLSPSMAKLLNADLEPASTGRITFNASAELNKWSFSNTSPVQVNLDASNVSIVDLTQLAGQPIPVSGVMNAKLALHGSELNPEGNGNILLANVNAYEQPVKSIKADFAGNGNEAHAALSVTLSAGSLQGKISVRPKEKTYDAQIASEGIHLDQLEALKARNIPATGVVSLNARGQGSFDNPAATASIQIPNLVIQNQTISGVNLRMDLANHIANAQLQTAAVNTSIQGNARVNLTGDYQTEASLDTKQIPLQPLFAVYAPTLGATTSGETEIHATLRGPLKNKNLLEAHVTIPILKMDYNSTVNLAAISPIHVDYKNGVINLARSGIRGTDTDLQFEGSIPTTGSGAMSLLATGTVNLQLAQLFDPDIRSSGELKLNINTKGAMTGPDVAGQIEIVDANLASNDVPVGLQHANGLLNVTKDRINVSKFEGTIGGGTVTAQGGVAYRPNVQFDLGLAAHGVRILYPQGMRESVSANLRLSGSAETAQLGGSVNLTELSFTPAFDLSSFVSQFSGGVSAPPSQGFSQNLQLNLAVHSTNDVNLVSRTLSVGGSANLQVRGTAATPVILGRVSLNSGDIILNGNRFVLNGGTVQFVNPSETEPVLNLTLSTTIQQYNIDLRFNGPVDQMRTEYSSNPALPSADIINLLAFGQTTEASAANPTPTNQAAESLVASQVSSQVTSRISKIAGISQLSISPVLAGSNSQGPAGANITIQQRVTGNLFITFSSNVASTQSQTIQGQYQISPRVAVSATRDPNGGFAFDTLIKKSW